MSARESSLVVFMLTLVLLSEPRPSNGLCTLGKNGTLARCHYLEDVNTIEEIPLQWLKSLRVLSAGRHLSADNRAFAHLTNLRHLDLSNGKLRKLDPGCFRQLLSLRTLDLADNHLTHLSPGTLQGLDHLQSLNLKKNLLEEIPADVVALNDLKHLDISHNNLNCDCEFLKLRDSIIKRGVALSKKTICNAPESLKGQLLIELKTYQVCMADELDDNLDGMQMDQPLAEEGSGEGSGDAFDELDPEDIPDDEEKVSESETHSTTTSIPVQVSLTPETTTSGQRDGDDGIFFNEDTEKHSKPSTTTTVSTSLETTTEIPVEITVAVVEDKEENKDKGEDKNNEEDEVEHYKSKEENEDKVENKDQVENKDKVENKNKVEDKDIDGELWEKEGSGDDDADDPWVTEGSGEGSGVEIPHITWDEDDSLKNMDNSQDNTSETVPTSTTESTGIISSIWGMLWGTTPRPPASTTEELDLEEEQFIKATSEATEEEEKPKEKVEEEVITPVQVVPVENESIKPGVLDDGKLGQVRVESPVDVTGTDASADKQETQKGMGSYVVLAILLAVLATLIGFAAYKGSFCRKGRKRNDHDDNNDVENGTELKDLRKSLLDTVNSTQPKISTNGNSNKPESMPLVNSGKGDNGIKINDDEPTAKYIGTVNESVDPVKPPRKSFSPGDIDSNDNHKKDGTNGKIVTTSQLSPDPSIMRYPRVSNNREIMANGGGNRDSLSSSGSHSRLSNLRLNQDLQPPGSPGAQRVKITLQDIPDSVPKTPLLITRTKAGENLVKT
ncbi:hypothetical protein G9C98_005804 [Cotesia typhae]|uniref:Uncharacterized protein n=1 Tax=Cotesia typhae TaxID=2053667 RepID=A0A8J5V9P1_9HYME|nr:hypothetical protein G9C98_005804 [Cotesia typhae]